MGDIAGKSAMNWFGNDPTLDKYCTLGITDVLLININIYVHVTYV